MSLLRHVRRTEDLVDVAIIQDGDAARYLVQVETQAFLIYLLHPSLLRSEKKKAAIAWRVAVFILI